MNASTEDRMLLAATAAALAKRGWPAAKTAALLAEAMPAGPRRAALEAAAASLSRGETPSVADDPAIALLARGDAAGASALAEMAYAESLSLRARVARVSAFVYPGALAALGALLQAAVIALGVIDEMYADFGASLPPPTMFILATIPLLQVAAVTVLAGATVLFVATALGFGYQPGVRALRAASSLRQVAAGLRSGLAPAAAFALGRKGATGFDSLGLDARERALAQRLATHDGPESAARSIAAELEYTGRDGGSWARALLPFLGILAVLSFAGCLGIAALLPMATLSGFP